MDQFGLAPVAPLDLAMIAEELGLSEIDRCLGPMALAAFTLAATLPDNGLWEMVGTERFMTGDTFFEHLGLIGGLLLVAWHELHERLAEDVRR